MIMRLRTFTAVAVACALSAASAARAAPNCTDPVNFVAGDAIDNLFAPFKVGHVATHSDGEETGVVTVTDRKIRAGGILWTVVLDESRLAEDGHLTEMTWDLYAKNRQGDTCYGGEITMALELPESGSPRMLGWSYDGSFVHGVTRDGKVGKAGVYMPSPASLHVGMQFDIENMPGEAVEKATVTKLTTDAVTIRVEHPEDGEVETKVFTRGKGQTFAQVTGEAPERLVGFRPAGDDGAP
jgi:hypothetical protein